MLRFNEILIVFGTFLTLGLTGPALKKIEHLMRDLAVESHRSGYISIQGFQRQLERGR